MREISQAFGVEVQNPSVAIVAPFVSPPMISAGETRGYPGGSEEGVAHPREGSMPIRGAIQ